MTNSQQSGSKNTFTATTWIDENATYGCPGIDRQSHLPSPHLHDGSASMPEKYACA